MYRMNFPGRRKQRREEAEARNKKTDIKRTRAFRRGYEEQMKKMEETKDGN